ncbi:MAG: hypothetical protein ACIAQZ_02450 [Sedimentisphaeraceae bacterium JB056]
MKLKKTRNILFLTTTVLCVYFFVALQMERRDNFFMRSTSFVMAQRVGELKAEINFQNKNYVYYSVTGKVEQKDICRSYLDATDLGFNVRKLEFENEIFPYFLNQKDIRHYESLKKHICRFHNAKLIKLTRNQNKSRQHPK